VDLDFLSRVLSIIVIDLVLSGDNAVVIGMAARSLSTENRRKAIVWGGVGAVVLRIFFTAIAAVLLGVPYLQAIGGVLLLFIAYRLIRPHDEGANIRAAGNLREAIQTIVLADVVMSLDNILAVGGAAHGNLWLLLFGLVLSIPILLLGSELVARMLGRFPALVYVGAIVLVWTAVGMIVEDKLVHEWREIAWWQTLLLSGAAAAVVILLGLRTKRLATPPEVAERVEDQAAPDVQAEDAAHRAAPRPEPVATGAISPNGREPVGDRPGARRPTP
jgi:YjbE family integral membrane protein